MSNGDPKSATRIRNVGFGGCGCALPLLLIAIVLLVFGLDPKTEEALPFAIITFGLASLVGVIGLGLIIWGLVAGSKTKG